MANLEQTEFTIDLTADAHAAGVARRFVAEHSGGLPVDLIDDAELLVSELVTNAVKHGRPLITLQISLEPPLIGVAVSDQGRTPLPPGTSEPSHDATGGRGLLIVDRLSTSWGVIPTDPPPGKTVWFRLDNESQP